MPFAGMSLKRSQPVCCMSTRQWSSIGVPTGTFSVVQSRNSEPGVC